MPRSYNCRAKEYGYRSVPGNLLEMFAHHPMAENCIEPNWVPGQLYRRFYQLLDIQSETDVVNN
jgi:hypothetical protein